MWQKKNTDLFDVTMGSFDGAETCELVGSFLLSQLKEKLGDNMGLYRDDGLGVTEKSPRETEKIKKEITTIFKNNGLRITMEANKKSVNFLDVTLNLAGNSYSPYSKPNSTPLYVNQQINHPPSVLRNIPAALYFHQTGKHFTPPHQPNEKQ